VAFAFFSTAVAAIIVEVDSFFGTGVDLAEARTMFASAGFAFSSCFKAVGSSATETCCTCTGFISEALCFVCNVGKGHSGVYIPPWVNIFPCRALRFY
jgi:hypothetical protein